MEVLRENIPEGATATKSQNAVSNPFHVGSLRWPHLAAILIGVTCAVLVSRAGNAVSALEKLTSLFTTEENSEASSAGISEPDLNRQKPQKQAEILLTRAVSRDDRAASQIQSHVANWRGKIKWDAQLSDLTTVALNSKDEAVRSSAIEVQLAAYGLTKNKSTASMLERQAKSADHARKVWALWSLGLLGNRGVETDHIVQVLTAHLRGWEKGADEDARRWAVEALALVGTTPTITPLLQAMHNDPSSLIRERAACSLAASGMLSHEQRLIAVPQLISYSADAALDAQTRSWAFQALRDITQQRLPNDPGAWRNWYGTAVTGVQ
jgi:HEAT repeat protein